jgi:hypothetical protein
MLGTYNAFGIFLPGNQIPDWFTHKGEGPSICFEVRIVDQMLKGFGVCVVYSSRVLVLGSYRGRMSIINHTKNNILAYQSPESSGGCNTPSPLRLGLSLFFFYNKIFAKIHKVYQST